MIQAGEAEAPTTTGGSPNAHVYFQPPTNVEIKYPCIVYSAEPTETQRADNRAYLKKHPYKVQFISTRPESPILDMILDYPYSRMTATYCSDGLYYTTYKLYI